MKEGFIDCNLRGHIESAQEYTMEKSDIAEIVGYIPKHLRKRILKNPKVVPETFEEVVEGCFGSEECMKYLKRSLESFTSMRDADTMLISNSAHDKIFLVKLDMFATIRNIENSDIVEKLCPDCQDYTDLFGYEITIKIFN